MRDWLSRFMMGRYGIDPLGWALMILYIVLSVFLSGIPHVLVRLIVIFPLFLCWFRLLSRDIYRRREENRLSGVALQQCLTDCSANTKITIDLKGRMRIHQIGIARKPEKATYMLHDNLPVTKPGINICQPSIGPACTSASIFNTVLYRLERPCRSKYPHVLLV